VLFSGFFLFLVRFLPVFVPNFALFPSMSCAYLYVHNFPRTHVSRIGRGNLASDKETALEGQGRRGGHCGLRSERRKANGTRGGGDRAPSRLAASRRRARALGGRRANLAFDKETAAATGKMTKSEDRMTNQIRMTNGGGRQSGVRDLWSQSRRAGTQACR
jgi:hypothetical protein